MQLPGGATFTLITLKLILSSVKVCFTRASSAHLCFSNTCVFKLAGGAKLNARVCCSFLHFTNVEPQCHQEHVNSVDVTS